MFRSSFTHPFRWLLAVSVLVAAGQASASVVTVGFTGVVDAVDSDLSSGFSVGQTLSGTYSFESTTPARAGSDSNFAVFDALTSVNFSIGSYSGSSSGAPEIQVDNDPPPPNVDRYAVLSRSSEGLSGPAVNGFDLNTFAFVMFDATNTVFTDALILPLDPNLSQFTDSGFFLFFNTALSSAQVSGHLTSLSTVAVPEASTLALSACGLVALIAFARKRVAKAG